MEHSFRKNIFEKEIFIPSHVKGKKNIFYITENRFESLRVWPTFRRKFSRIFMQLSRLLNQVKKIFVTHIKSRD